MTRVRVHEEIAAPVEVVFRAVTDMENSSKVNPEVVGVEFLTDRRNGKGTRFRETRRMGKRELTCELEITEFVENERARFVTEMGGTLWDTVFTTSPSATGTRLTVDMEARAQRLLPKIMNPVMRPLFRRGMVKHLGVLADYCERQ